MIIESNPVFSFCLNGQFGFTFGICRKGNEAIKSRYTYFLKIINFSSSIRKMTLASMNVFKRIDLGLNNFSNYLLSCSFHQSIKC